MKKQLHKSIVLLALFSAGYAFAQSQILEGRVLDEKDNTPIQGVKVKVTFKMIFQNIIHSNNNGCACV